MPDKSMSDCEFGLGLYTGLLGGGHELTGAELHGLRKSCISSSWIIHCTMCTLLTISVIHHQRHNAPSFLSSKKQLHNVYREDFLLCFESFCRHCCRCCLIQQVWASWLFFCIMCRSRVGPIWLPSSEARCDLFLSNCLSHPAAWELHSCLCSNRCTCLLHLLLKCSLFLPFDFVRLSGWEWLHVYR